MLKTDENVLDFFCSVIEDDLLVSRGEGQVDAPTALSAETGLLVSISNISVLNLMLHSIIPEGRN